MTKRSIHWKELCKNPNQEVSSFTLCHEKIYPSIMTDTDIVEQINLILTYKTSQCLQRDILVPTVSFGVQRWEACGGVEGSSIQIVPHHPPHHTICKLNPSAFVSPPLSPFSFAHQLFHKPDFDNLRRCCHHWTAPNTQSQLTAVLLIWNPGFFLGQNIISIQNVIKSKLNVKKVIKVFEKELLHVWNIFVHQKSRSPD